MNMLSGKVVIVGAGPAGMGCAYTLTKAKQPCIVIEKEFIPGGLCRTLNFHGYRFDIGGHRFISKSNEVNEFWNKVLGDDMLKVKRLSRIYYRKKYFKYPLSFFNTFWNLGPLESFLCVASYLRCKCFKASDDSAFEGWVINRFGKRLYDIFFKTYTEKVWAATCQNISADWAKQRIRGLSLRVAIKNAFFVNKKNIPKTLSEEFFFPRTGSGTFYQRVKDVISALGGEFEFNTTLTALKHNGRKIISVEVQDVHQDKREEILVDYLFSSIPLPDLARLLDPKPPENVVASTRNLCFRSLLVVNIILNKGRVFPDQWIYVHSPEVKLGRIQNYKNWSSTMVMDSRKTSLGLEYFCTEGDDLWRMNDIDLINYAVAELEKIGVVSRKHLIDGFVVRCSNVYPVYSLDYKKSVDTIHKYLRQFSNFQTIGRAGLFRYDNSDHALLTGIYAARNFLGEGHYDVWGVNADETYLES